MTSETIRKHKAKQRERRLQTCTHFNGVGGFVIKGDGPKADDGKCCEAGVNYRQLVGGELTGWMRKIPCTPPFKEGDPPPVPCDKHEFATEAEIDAEDAEFERTHKLIEQGLSPCCEVELNTSHVITEGQHKGHGPRFCSKCRKLVFMV